MTAPEKILCVSREILAKHAIAGIFSRATDSMGGHGFYAETISIMSVLAQPDVVRPIERSKELEDNTKEKQLVSYVVLIDPFKGTIFSYYRSKIVGEKRLAGNLSIGVGGHININDMAGLPFSIQRVILNSTIRELVEEVNIQECTVGGNILPTLLGFINDDRDPVGRVHLGLCSFVFVDSEKLESTDDNLVDAEFRTADELFFKRETMESWSKIALDYITTVATS